MRAYPRVHIRPRPNSPRNPAAQDYEESPRPATATSHHDPITPTHAQSSAQDRGPAQGQLWPRRTYTQLWELRKSARAEPSLKGLVHRSRERSVENCRLQQAGGVDAAGGMRSHAGRFAPPPGSPPLATSPRPRTTGMSSGACGRPSRRHRETASASKTSPKAQPRTHTPPRHPTSVGAPTPAVPIAPQEPCAPHSTTRLNPRPAAPPPGPVTQPATAAGRHARPCPEDTKQTGNRRTRTHTPTGTATPKDTEPKPATVTNA